MSDTDTSQSGAAEAPAKPVNPDLRWYVVHAYSGMEKAVERNIRERINRAGMQDMFGEILVPAASIPATCWCR
jgi:transcriptional antiterminator NusG